MQKTEVAAITGEHRLNMTRVNANEVVDELMSGINFSSETTEESKTCQSSALLMKIPLMLTAGGVA